MIPQRIKNGRHSEEVGYADGAGAQHACGVADRLGIPSIIVPIDAGLLSALGLRDAVMERFAAEQVLRDDDEVREMVIGNDQSVADAVCNLHYPRRRSFSSHLSTASNSVRKAGL